MKKFLKKSLAVIFAGVMVLGSTACSLDTGKIVTGTFDDTSSSSSSYTYSGDIITDTVLSKVALLEAIIDANYYFEVDDETLTDGIYAGIVDALDDPYAKYYTAEEYAALIEDSSGSYAGIGVTVLQDEDTGYPIATAITEGSPAEDVGVMVDDYITAVDGYEIQSTDDLDYIVSLIRGEEGTDVEIVVYRPSENEYITFTITRKTLDTKTVSYFMAEDGIGYIRVTQFVSNTPELFQDAMEDLLSQGMEALMIDLRSNPGGMLTAVVEMCDLLLSDGLIVYVEDKNGNVIESYSATSDDQLNIPMAVLVNGGSASASELMSGALQDHECATIIGTQTYGKGIVQTVLPLGDGTAIKLTTAKYFTPNGNDIHEIGITPDIVIELPDDYTSADFQGDNDSQYQKGLSVLREALGTE